MRIYITVSYISPCLVALSISYNERKSNTLTVKTSLYFGIQNSAHTREYKICTNIFYVPHAYKADLSLEMGRRNMLQ